MKLRKLLLAALMLIAFGSMAQLSSNIENDPSVRTGKLPNGLTYYIKQNNWPEHRVNFYIAQRVGSLQEEENQRGLAHFLEHMAFNGSKNFPGNGVIDYTRSLGVEFGRDLNAYTSVDQTVYNINDVPSTRQSAIDSCLLILKDWSNGLLLEDEEIDKERGVIHEEWRVRSSAQQRLYERNLETLYPNSKYGLRMPIGLMSVVDNFKYNELRDYYHKWYRPDNQAIVVVGDIDVDRTEAKIKEMFSDIPAPAPDAAQVVDEPVPDNDEPIIIIDKDKELTSTSVSVMFKHEPIPDEFKSTIMYLLQGYARSRAFNMLYQRLDEKAKEPDCPYIMAFAGDGTYLLSKTKDAFSITAIPKEGQTAQAIKAVTEEVLRAAQHGFTATEYARSLDEYTSYLEESYNNRNQIDNDNFGRQYCSNYLEKYPYPSIEWKYNTMNMIAPHIPLDLINQTFAELVPQDNSNMVILNFCTDNAELPVAQDLIAAVNDARNEKLEAYVDNVKDEPLIATMPKAGKIVKETKNEKLGYTQLTLSNGATVIIKPTTFMDDEIQYYAESRGGSSLYGKDDVDNFTVLAGLIESSGLGNFSNSELKKALAGKNVQVNMSLSDDYESFDGYSTKKDLETMFQLNYLYFTDIKKDEKAVNSMISMLDNFLKNKDAMPQSVFSDSLIYTYYNHNWRHTPISSETLKKIDYDRVLQIAKERTANAADFTFYFVGSFDEATIKPLIEQYIASLPAQKGKKEDFGEMVDYAQGKKTNLFSHKMETPQVTSRIMWHTYALPYTMENDILADITGQVLEDMLLKKVREDEGAAYSPNGWASISYSGHKVVTTAAVSCNFKPEKKDIVLGIMRESLNEIANGQVTQDILDKIKEKMAKDFDTNLKDNNYWIGLLSFYVDRNIDEYNGYKEALNKITTADISNFVKNSILKSGNCIEITMVPEE
ncbi:MAG: insulinase family protein [Muribaculaceae bacterium]|nr:insulinase family protein [Muribaculaceae bacterium]